MLPEGLPVLQQSGAGDCKHQNVGASDRIPY